jgi:signal transduction histidine kinase
MHRQTGPAVLRFSDVALNRDRPLFDIHSRMSPSNNSTNGSDPRSPGPRNPAPRNPDPRNPDPRNPGPRNPDPRNPGPRDPGPDATPDPVAQLAHELANLLDGSLRHLGIAIDTLRETDRPPADPSDISHTDGDPANNPVTNNPVTNNPAADNDPADPADPDAILLRLQTTDRAMRQMVSLIHAWMKRAPQPRELFDQSQTLRQTLEQVVDLHRPSASRQGIELCLTFGDGAADLPAGPIFPIAANAIRNSIEAIADADPTNPPGHHRIDIAASRQDDQLRLTISDDGPGLDPSMYDDQGRLLPGRSTKPHGHGLGLTLSQQVAAGLRGTLELTPRDPRGTQLTLRCPLASLAAPDQPATRIPDDRSQTHK